MSKLGDLWVKLGLKSEDYSKGLDQAVGKTNGLKKAFSAIKGVGVAALASLAAAAVAAFGKMLIESNKFGDKWRGMVGGMKNVWNTFTSSLLNWDWDGFWDKVRGAYKGGKALADTEDAMFEILNSIKLRRADMEKENASLRIAMQDQNKTYEQRADAARKYLANVKPLYDEEARAYEEYKRKMEKSWLAPSGLGDTGENRAKLEEYLRRGAKLTDDIKNDPIFAAIDRQYKAYDDKRNGKLVDIYVTAMEKASAFEEENRKIFNNLNSAIAQTGKSVEAVNPADILPALADVDRILSQVEAREEAHRRFWSEVTDGIKKDTEEAFGELGEGIDAQWDAFFSEFEQTLTDGMVDLTQVLSDLAKEFSEAVSEGFVDSVQALTDALFGLEDMDGGKMVAALLSPLADMVTQMGKLIMAAGVAESALFTSLMHPGPEMAGAAIAAGAALVAIGAAAKSGLKALAGGTGNANAATSTYAGGSTGAGANTIQTELTIHIDGKLKGSDIVLSGQRTLNSWSR